MRSDTEVSTQRAAEFEKIWQESPNSSGLAQSFRRQRNRCCHDCHAKPLARFSTIWACQAGKDVYVEKPGAHTIWEGRKMVEAANKYNRIVQHGVQLRSSEDLLEVVQHLRKGVIGNVYMARGIVYRWRGDIGNHPVEPTPSTLNYDLWLGPAASRPFNANRFHYNWHWFWDYGTGELGNWGVHLLDVARWGLGVGLPERVTSMGGKFLWDDSKETPEALFQLPLSQKRKNDRVEVGRGAPMPRMKPWWAIFSMAQRLYGHQGIFEVRNLFGAKERARP